MRHEPPPINVRPAAWTADTTASTVAAANSWPVWSTLPIMGESGAIWTLALKRLAPRTVRLIVDWWRMRSPVKRPESGSAWTASDPDKGTRKESLRTVRNPCSPYVISRMNVLSALLAVPAGALLPDPAINGTKRHIAVDTGGLLLAVTEREYDLMHRVPHLVAVHRRPGPILPAVRHRELRPEGEAFRRGRLLPVLETQPQDGPHARHCCTRPEGTGCAYLPRRDDLADRAPSSSCTHLLAATLANRRRARRSARCRAGHRRSGGCFRTGEPKRSLIAPILSRYVVSADGRTGFPSGQG